MGHPLRASIQIEAEIPKDPWSLSGDATQLLQVLLNLCLNARDAMPQGGILTLAGENVYFDKAFAGMHPEAKVGPYLLFAVEDSGCGIPPSISDKTFDLFFTTKERGRGTGLGLSTVHGIVKRHGGFVEVSSEVEKGTTFRVYLPTSPSAEVQKAEEAPAFLPSGKGKLILVVEDEASIREITQATLEAHGYQVMTARDGAEAVSLYAQHPGKIQAVITDMAMPVMDCPATIRALQRIQPAVKVIVVSGMAWGKPLAKAISDVMKAFLQKPFTADKLPGNVAEVLWEPEEQKADRSRQSPAPCFVS
jgi:hypothetical protein